MDKIPALKQAYTISLVSAKCRILVSIIQRISGRRSDEFKSAQTWGHELQKDVQALRLIEADSTGVQSKSDELRSLLIGQCEELAWKVACILDIRKEACQNTDAINAPTIDNIARMTANLEHKLNNELARCEWVSISDSIRELWAKNSRLGANRATDISNLSNEVDNTFRNITSSNSREDGKSMAWKYIIEMMPQVVDFTVEQTILTTLQFWTMYQRKELIEKEHEDTFGWILSDDSSIDASDEATSNFVEWLRGNEALYWISGKPGSGKSTLMKFIAESSKTQDVLQANWTKDEKLIMAEFYFWSSAKDSLQKSDSGLMRSILFQILRQCPDMIQHAYPKEWEERYSSQAALRKLVRDGQTMQEFLDTFNRVSVILPETKTKFCFFIDGLDEFDGDPANICRLIESFKSIRNLKLCVSSRQWAQFENVFGGDNPWRVYIHEKTRLDMEKYVRGLLIVDKQFSDATVTDCNITKLVHNIARKAEGVFLWSFLVVRDLINAIQNTNTEGRVKAMELRLLVLPQDLDGYFNMMFEHTASDMRAKTAQTFQLTLKAVEKLPLLCYWLAEKGDLEEVLKLERHAVLNRQPEILSNALGHLKKFSKGLLHVKRALKTDCIPNDISEKDFLFGFRVDFIHRTVADFLNTPEMKQLFYEWVTPSHNVGLDICKASIATLRVMPPVTSMFDDGSCALSMLHLLLSHINAVEASLQTRLLDSVFYVLQNHANGHADIPMKILGSGNYWAYGANFKFIFLYQCVSYNLFQYVVDQLKKPEQPFSEPPSGLLSACFSWDARVKGRHFTLSSETVKNLLQAGLDPNLPWGDRDFSFWQQVLTSSYSRHLKGITNEEDFATIKHAVEHGADLDAEVEVLARKSTGGVRARELLEKVLPADQRAILNKSQKGL